MSDHVFLRVILTIAITILISFVLIRKDKYASPLKIFIPLYIIFQILGYGLNIEIFKAVIPASTDPESGAAYQIITSTILPLLFAFIINDIFSKKKFFTYNFIVKLMLVTLIFLGLLQLYSFSKVLDYILLAVLIILWVLGYKKRPPKKKA